MSTPLFSVNGAAEALERDRRTITKALRHTKPDGKQHGQDRWRLKTILAALEVDRRFRSSHRSIERDAAATTPRGCQDEAWATAQ